MALTLAPLPVGTFTARARPLRMERPPKPEPTVAMDMRGLLRGARGSGAALVDGRRATPDGYLLVGGPSSPRLHGGRQCGRCGLRLGATDKPWDFAGCDAGSLCPMGVE